ncbi:MAG: hypothetical protein LJE70_13340 [Chromatiaceae bacterium]|nr:hypothetical protein [Chromatiaceae bacterium]
MPGHSLIDYTRYVDGMVAAERGLPGKPAPDTFLAAARDLGVALPRTVVIDDCLNRGAQATVLPRITETRYFGDVDKNFFLTAVADAGI